MTKLRWTLAALAAALLASTPLPAQEPATVSGRVTGPSGAGEAGVTVRIAALNVSAVTAGDGSYRLTIPAARIRAGQQATVTASRVGLSSQSRTVTLQPGAQLTQSFQLGNDVLQLEGIVATGIGQTTTRERLGVAISSVSGEEVTRVQTPNIVSALAAKAPNVQVTSSAGDPGASAYIRIRGQNTILGNGQPLFVVDGVPIDNEEVALPSSLLTTGGTSENPVALAATVNTNRAADLNPADIQSVEILKGAAASAVYGARAANGVVLITTRKGTAGRTQVSLTTTLQVDQVNRSYPLQRSFAQGQAGVTDTSGAFIRAWGARLGVPAHDHFGELFEEGRITESNLSISGGTDRTTYYLSLGGLDHDGVISGDNDFHDRRSVRLKGSHMVRDNLTVNGSFAYTATDGGFTQKGSNISGLLLGGLRTPPSFDNCIPGTCYRTAEGFQRTYTNPNPGSLTEGTVFDNPFFVIDQNRSTSEVGRTFGNIGARFQPLNWLTLDYTLGLDYSNDERLDVYPQGNAVRATGYMQQATLTTRSTDHNLVATAERQLSDDVGGTLTLGWNRNARRFDRLFAEGFDFVAENLYTLDNVLTTAPDPYVFRIHSESFFGQAQLNLYDQLFLTAALRNDGFSTFGASQRRHLYPKASAAWEFTRLAGFPRTGVLSRGKVRAAWGQAGNEPPVYGTIGGLTSAAIADGGWGTNLVGNAYAQGAVYSGINRDQPDLKPERTSETELGVDLGFLNDRAGLGVTWYNATTRDAILRAPLDPASGFFQQLRNAATIRNRGWEVTLDLRPVERKGVTWDVGATWATNDNRVLSLGDSTTQFINMGGGFASATGAAYKGLRVGVLQGNDFARCGRGLTVGGVELDTGPCAGAPEGALYIGADGFPRIDPTLRVIGDPNPDWTAGVRSTLTLFQRVQVYTLLDFRHGGDIWNGTRGALYSYGTHADTEGRATCGQQGSTLVCTGNEQVFGTDLVPGPVAGPGAGRAVPIGENWFRAGLGSSFGGVNTPYIEDGGYVKLREVAVSYAVPQALARRVGLGGIDLRLAGRNLHTWTDYTGLDPETNVAGGTNLRGIDYFNNPQTRQWIVTVGLTR